MQIPNNDRCFSVFLKIPLKIISNTIQILNGGNDGVKTYAIAARNKYLETHAWFYAGRKCPFKKSAIGGIER